MRFIVKNSGKTMHEMVLGTMQELKEHAEVMKKHPGMEHDEPYMAHVAAGQDGRDRLAVHEGRASSTTAASIPGHFEAGMVGRIKSLRQ